MQRRTLLFGLAGVLTLPVLSMTRVRAAVDARNLETIRTGWRELLAEGAEIAESTEPLERSAEAWRRQLGDSAYRVLFEEATERAFTSPLNDEKRPGIYVCAACDLPLFSSAMKYDSGTGWPSFFTHIPECFGTKTDYRLILPRTEYHCIKCGGHHGHVFNDGPPPTGERWCNNGVALRFIPANG